MQGLPLAPPRQAGVSGVGKWGSSVKVKPVTNRKELSLCNKLGLHGLSLPVAGAGTQACLRAGGRKA